MKAMEVVELRIIIPRDDAHLERVLDAIAEFKPSSEVNVTETYAPFDNMGKRLPAGQHKSYVVEFLEEQCRAQIFVDALHEDFKPASIVATFVSLLEGNDRILEAATASLAEQVGAQP